MADEPDDLVVVVDGEHHPVAEPVEESAVAGVGGEAGGEQLVVAGAALPEVVQEAGPAGGCVPDGEPRVVVQVGTEPVEEIPGGPGAAVAGGEEREGVAVELQDPPAGDRFGLPDVQRQGHRVRGVRVVRRCRVARR